MDDRVRVQDLEALRNLKSAFGRFAGEAHSTLNSVESELRRTLDWLQERVHHWQRQVERSQQELQRARAALSRCESSAYRDSDGRYYVPDCSAYEAAVIAAQRRLQQTEKELASARRWQTRVREEATEYRVEAQRLERLSSVTTPKARALLDRKTADLQAYLAVSVSAAVAGTLPVLVRALSAVYERSMGNRRSSAVRLAKQQESDLVKATGKGTRNKWSRPELRLLGKGSFPKGKYHGHHINNVHRFPELADNPDNITFVTPKEHLQLHRRNWHNATSGKMFNRKSLIVQWAKHKQG